LISLSSILFLLYTISFDLKSLNSKSLSIKKSKLIEVLNKVSVDNDFVLQFSLLLSNLDLIFGLLVLILIIFDWVDVNKLLNLLLFKSDLGL
jgi:hypothetical protein